MNAYSNRGRVLPVAAVVLALIAVVAIVASGALGRAGSAGPMPSATPSGTPKPTPVVTPTPTPVVTPTPSDEPADGLYRLDLTTVDGNDVAIVIDDQTGTIVKVSSGKPGDGMSVRWLDMKIENVDDRTLRLTWVGLPVDDEVELSVSRIGGRLDLRFVQPAPYPNTDAMGSDRVLVVEFDGPVSADDVSFSFETPA